MTEQVSLDNAGSLSNTGSLDAACLEKGSGRTKHDVEPESSRNHKRGNSERGSCKTPVGVRRTSSEWAYLEKISQ